MSKIKDLYRECKKEIIVSLITTFVIIVLNNLYQYIKSGGKIVLNIFRDFIYFEMSRITELALVEFICSLVLGTFFAFFIYTLIIAFFRKRIIAKYKNKKLVKEKNNKDKNDKKITILSILMTLIVIFYTMYASIILGCLDAKRRFDRNMTALKPYITQEEYDILYSKWVTMMSKNDYLEIQKEIGDLKCTYIFKNCK